MSLAFNHEACPQIIVDWPGLMQELGPGFAARAATHDATDTFVAENFAELKARGALAAAVPGELGGGGAPYPALCEMLRVLGRYCGSTALTLSMHTHLAATAAWRWRRGAGAVEGLLRRIADERLLLVGSGASDWLTPTGVAERLDGGWRINAKKVFASGIPGGDLFMTQALHEHPETGPTALHFAIPIDATGVEPQDTWRALGMRGTGSHHVLLRDDRARCRRFAAATGRPVDAVVPSLRRHHPASADLCGLSRHRGGGTRCRVGRSRANVPTIPGSPMRRRDGERACRPPGWRIATWSRRPSAATSPDRRRPTAS